jgi:hypothetical protein
MQYLNNEDTTDVLITIYFLSLNNINQKLINLVNFPLFPTIIYGDIICTSCLKYTVFIYILLNQSLIRNYLKRF